MKEIKVLQIITGLKPGGAEKVLFDIIKNSSKDNLEHYVISLSDKVHLLQKFQKNGINVEPLYMKKSLLSFIRSSKKLLNHIRTNRINVIHAHMTHALVMACAMKFLKPSIKIVFTPHNFNLGSIWRELILFFLKPFRDVDIIFSNKMKKYYHKDNYVILPNGVDTSEFNIEADKMDKFTFISIGRIEPQKNHVFLVDIVKKIKNSIDNFQILIVGDGFLVDELKDKIKGEKLNDYFNLIGFSSNIPELCKKSHVFILHSLWEGFPIVMLEAGASGLPIISTQVGSIPSVLNDENGYLCDYSVFGECMIHVYNNYDEAVRKGERFKQKVNREYDISLIAKKHESIYRKLCQSY